MPEEDTASACWIFFDKRLRCRDSFSKSADTGRRVSGPDYPTIELHLLRFPFLFMACRLTSALAFFLARYFAGGPFRSSTVPKSCL